MSQRTVEVAGGSLWYRAQGMGPALILMGGGPSNADTLEPLAARLADDFTVVTYDRRGYSRSHVSDPAGPTGPASRCTPMMPAAWSPISDRARSRSSAPASVPSSPSSSPPPSPPPSALSSFTSRRWGSCWPATTASPST